MRAALNAMLPRDRAPRVLVVGDLILDEYLRGQVSRISPEAPVPVLASSHRDAVPGGAANVANNLAALGCEVLVVGAIGDDEHGERLLELLGERGIRTHGIIRDSSRPTTHKLRVIAHQQQVLRIDREESRAVSDTVATDALEIVRQTIADVDGVVCSDYQKGFVTPELLAGIVEVAGAHGKRVAVDPKGVDYSRYRGVDVLTPNRAELAAAAGFAVDTPSERDRAARQVLETTGARALLVTCGRDGMVLYAEGGSHEVQAEAREVFDVTGAGDTVVSVFALGMFAGVPALKAARLANAAASIVVGKLGTAIVDRDELEEWLAGVATSAAKVVSLEEAERAVARARVAGKTVVTTNGVFDLVHPGHVAVLEGARALGDLLVVGVNSDESVRRLDKGDGRPLQPEAARARILAAFACVDYVVVFGEPDPVALVRALRPDVHVKGGDYELSAIVEKEAVEAGGGRVELLPVEPGWSTSSIVATICGGTKDEP